MMRTGGATKRNYKIFKIVLTKENIYYIIYFASDKQAMQNIYKCASGSVVEYRLAKARVAGSNPVSRLRKRNEGIRMDTLVSFFESNPGLEGSNVSASLRSVQDQGPPDLVNRLALTRSLLLSENSCCQTTFFVVSFKWLFHLFLKRFAVITEKLILMIPTLILMMFEQKLKQF